MKQRRYRWRHDRVLEKLADIVEKERTKKRTKKKRQETKNFVKEGAKTTAGSNAVQKSSILDTGSVWELRVDLRKKLVFPDIVTTTLRPDMVLW